MQSPWKINIHICNNMNLWVSIYKLSINNEEIYKTNKCTYKNIHLPQWHSCVFMLWILIWALFDFEFSKNLIRVIRTKLIKNIVGKYINTGYFYSFFSIPQVTVNNRYPGLTLFVYSKLNQGRCRYSISSAHRSLHRRFLFDFHVCGRANEATGWEASTLHIKFCVRNRKFKIWLLYHGYQTN